MKATRLMMSSAVLALGLALGAPALAQDIDFGDNSSTWADDGQCDDPRFEGPGAALIRSPVDEMRDAADCEAAFEAGEVTLVAADEPVAPAAQDAGEIDFGDDSGAWANDQECDDPRFGGTLDSHLMADATDCRTAYEAGEVTFEASNEVSGAVQPDGDIDFGDDSGAWANDGECDDPRFGGSLASHEMADATDCRTAYEAGVVTYDAPDDTSSDAVAGDIDFGNDTGTFANDGECDDPRFGGSLTSHEMADATDCRTAYEAGEVTYDAPDESGSDVALGDIDFGDDSGNWANDGECDDPRFGGALESHEMADATDCREALEAGEATYMGEGSGTTMIDGIDFGDDSGTYSNDAECDDPRFTGSGVGVALDDHLMADATDCSTAYSEGTVTLAEEGSDSGSNGDFRINFGDDSSASAYDGVCDDPRFQGRGGALELLESNMLADASDCRAAYESGTVTYEP